MRSPSTECWPRPAEGQTIRRARLVITDVSEEEDRLRELLRATRGETPPVRLEPVHAPIRMHRTATITLVVVVVASIAATVAWFQAVADRSRPLGEQRPTISVLTRPRPAPLVAVTRAVPCDVHEPFADQRQLRAFHPVAALRCDHVVRRGGLVTIRAVAAGPFGALVRGLERPDGVASAGRFCAMYLDVQPQLLLIDAAGRYIRPRFPRDGCGHVHGTPAYVAYHNLAWHRVSATAAANGTR